MDRRGDGSRTGVLVAADGHAWETDALAVIASAGDLVTLRRCLDHTDLLAVAAAGAARVAVVAATPGLDRDLVERLAAHHVVTVGVVPEHGGPAADRADEAARLQRIGVGAVVTDAEVGSHLAARLRDLLTGHLEAAPAGDVGRDGQDTLTGPVARGRVTAVWGATGAPGRTTVAIGVAAATARAARPTLLLDTDPYGGAVGQHLGILDESSGLLAAARHANSGTLTPDRLRGSARSVGDRLAVLTGLPRPDRWTEVRARNVAEVVHRAAEAADHVVVDAGFGAEAGRPGSVPSPRSRDALVTAVLEAADEVVVVGAAEPVALTRLARLLVDCRQVRSEGPAHVVVNRMRPGLGWREGEIVDMVARVCPAAQVHFVPFDLDGADRAMQEGRSPAESGSSRLGSALLRLGEAVTGAPATEARQRPRLVRASR
jgi:MinD-like ATPase involved in chromosome partitioning or flagellar assembly